MDMPHIRQAVKHVVPAPTNPLRERRLALLEQLAYAGPERFSLTSVFSTVEADSKPIDDNDDPTDHLAQTWYDVISAAGSGDLDEDDPKISSVLAALDGSVTFGACGRTACLGGHAQLVWFREHQQWISFDHAIQRFELPAIACAMHVSQDHPRRATFEHLLDLGESEEYAEWLVSIMVVRDLIDGRKEVVALEGFGEYNDFTDVDQLQDDGPF